MTVQTFKGRIVVRSGDSDVQVEVAIVVDLDAIAKKLAPKAFRSKAKKATLMNGAIVVKQVAAKAA